MRKAGSPAPEHAASATHSAKIRALILMFSLGIVAIAAAVLTVADLITWMAAPTSARLQYVGMDLVLVLFFAGLWLLNGRGHTRWVCVGFVIVMCLGCALGFMPDTLDRVLVIFVVPTLVAGFVLTPVASIPVALMSAMSYTLVYWRGGVGQTYNSFGVLGLFVVSLLSWRIATLLQNELHRRARTETALRHSEDKFHSFFEHSEDAIVLTDEQGLVTDWSRSAERLFGYTREEAIGQPIWDMQYRVMRDRTPEQFERLKGMMQAAYRDGQGPALNRLSEMTLQRPDGTRCDVQTMGFAMETDTGRRLGSISRDVTAQKWAEEHVRINEARLQSLFNIAQYKAESEQDLLDYALAETVKLTGSKIGYIYLYDEQAAQFTLNSWSKDVMQACQVQAPQTVYELAKTGIWGEAVRQRKPVVVNDYAAPNPLKKGYPGGHVELRRFLTVPVFAQERIVAVVGVANKESNYDEADARQCALLMDAVWGIAERRRAEEARRDSERRYRTFVNASADLVYLKDGSYRHILANEALCRYYGKPESEIIGRTDYELMPKEGADACRASDRTAVETRQLVITEETIGEHTFETVKFPVEVSQGETGVGGYIRDITERKRAEAQRHELEHRLQQAQRLESLGVLAGGIAHDFNNLLMAILGYAELAEKELPAGSSARASLQEIEEASQRATDLTRQMLAYAGRGQALLTELDLSALVQGMVQLVRVSVSKWAQLKLDLQGDLPCIRADAGQVRQIVMNLVINASEAIGDVPGAITVATGVMDCDADYLRASYLENDLPVGRYVYLEVTDTGCGMTKDTQQRIFEPFFTTKFTGRGLGLAAVLGIVRGHKGLLKLYSEPGRGTTFKVLFPALASRLSQEPPKVVEPEWQGSGTILLVDDETTVRSVARKMLEREGFTVLIATDGQMALDVYRENRGEIDVVLLDMTMPRMDGAETLRQLRNLNPDVRVILSSGYSDEVAGSYVQQGMAGFVQKPYTLASLKAALRQAFADRSRPGG